MKIVIIGVVLVALVVGVWWWQSIDHSKPRKVAVLVSAEYAESNIVLYDADFWYDTVLTYCMLRRNGFAEEDIYVLYGHGEDGFYLPSGNTQASGSSALTPGNTGEYYYMPPYCEESLGQRVNPITDFPMTYSATGTGMNAGASRPRDLLECLANGCGAATSDYGKIERLRARDFLFVWWKGHGTRTSQSPGPIKLTLPGLKSVTSNEVIQWVADVKAGRQLLVFETCHSGCMAEQLDTTDPPGVLFASAGCDEVSNNSYVPKGDVAHGVWSYWVDCILHGAMPNSPPEQMVRLPDESAMKVVLSVGKPLNRVFSESVSAAGYFSDQHPLKKDECGLAPHTKIIQPDPVGDAKVPCPPRRGSGPPT